MHENFIAKTFKKSGHSEHSRTGFEISGSIRRRKRKKVRERKTVKYNRKTERARQTDKEKERKKCVD